MEGALEEAFARNLYFENEQVDSQPDAEVHVEAENHPYKPKVI